MAVLDLVSETHPILQTIQPRYDFDNPPVDTDTLVQDLLDTMRHHGAIGLAAPQVNLPYNVFVMEIEGYSSRVCFNPVVVSVSDDIKKDTEGCLSFPDLWIKIKRPCKIDVVYQNHKGVFVQETFEDLMARCFLHETDHVNGITFTNETVAGEVSLRLAKNSRNKRLKKDSK